MSVGEWGEPLPPTPPLKGRGSVTAGLNNAPNPNQVLALLCGTAYAPRMGGAIDPAYSDLLARLYAGVASDRPWQAFLEDLARWMDASFATIIISTPGRRHPATFLTPGADAAFNATYAATLFADDPVPGAA